MRPIPLTLLVIVTRRLGETENCAGDDSGKGSASGHCGLEVCPAWSGDLRGLSASPRLRNPGSLAPGGNITLPGKPPHRSGQKLVGVPGGLLSFPLPSENLVWADEDGHIGWQAVGLSPVRPNWTGLLPVPGDGHYEWNGFVPAQDLPSLVDPPRGWFASANQDNLPRDFPHAVGFQWTDPFRFARIEEVLGSGRRFTLADMMRLQQDELSIPARALVPLLLDVRPFDGRARQAADRLKSWDLVPG